MIRTRPIVLTLLAAHPVAASEIDFNRDIRRITEIPGYLPAKLATAHWITTSRLPSEERLACLVKLYREVESQENAHVIVASVLLGLDDALVKQI